jgi:hypothetical protein
MIVKPQTEMNPPTGGWRFHLTFEKQIINK